MSSLCVVLKWFTICLAVACAACAAVPPQDSSGGGGQAPSAVRGIGGRRDPRWSVLAGLAQGDLSANEDDTARDDGVARAGFAQIGAEGISDDGFGAGLHLEWLRSHAELFANHGLSPHRQQDFEVAPYFVWRPDTGRFFRLPVRVGPYLHFMELDDTQSSNSDLWKSLGVRGAVEPELIIYRSSKFEFEVAAEFALGAAFSRIRSDTAASDDDFDSSIRTFGLDIGPRIRTHALTLGLSYMIRGFVGDESKSNGTERVHAYYSEYKGIMITAGIRL